MDPEIEDMAPTVEKQNRRWGFAESATADTVTVLLFAEGVTTSRATVARARPGVYRRGQLGDQLVSRLKNRVKVIGKGRPLQEVRKNARRNHHS